jgi:hypothetical protein
MSRADGILMFHRIILPRFTAFTAPTSARDWLFLYLKPITNFTMTLRHSAQ